MVRAKEAIMIVALSLLVTCIFFPSLKLWPNSLSEDDGYFYLEIAYNIGTIGMSSFDLLNETSGYHLAWMGFLSLIANLLAIFSDNKEFYLFGVFFLSVSLISSISHHFFKSWLQKACAFSILISTFSFTEVLFLSALCLFVIKRILINKIYLDKPLFISFILIPLIRIDAGLFCFAVAACFVLFHSVHDGIKLFFASCIGALFHFGLMYLFFENLWSVSSIAKSHSVAFNNILANVIYNLTASKEIFINAFFLISLNLLILVSIKRSHATFFVIAICFVAPNSLFLHYFFITELRGWYWTTPLILSFFIATQMGLQEKFYNYNISILIIVFTMSSSFGHLYTAVKYKVDRAYSQEFINKLNNITKLDQSIIYQIDGSGFVGYFSESPLVNGDGLTNSYQYIKNKHNYRLDNYLKESNICFIVINTNKNSNNKYLIDYFGLKILRSEVEMLISPPKGLKSFFSKFALYAIKREDCVSEA